LSQGYSFFQILLIDFSRFLHSFASEKNEGLAEIKRVHDLRVSVPEEQWALPD
jgi:hypothetical protein